MSKSHMYHEANQRDGHCWHAPLYLCLFPSFSDTTKEGEVVDICTTLDKKSSPQRSRPVLLNGAWLFPEEFNSATERQPINQYVMDAGADAGMKLIIEKSYEVSLASTASQPICKMWKTIFQCYRKKKAEKSTSKKGKGDNNQQAGGKTTLRAGVGESRCSFFFSIWFDFNLNRWFLPAQQGGCSTHVGHPQPDNNNVIQRGTSCVTEEEMETFMEQFQASFPPNMVRAWFREHRNITFTRHQVRGLQMKHRSQWSLYQIPKEHKGYVDVLINFLRDNNSIDSVILTGEREVATQDINIYLSKRQRDGYRQALQNPDYRQAVAGTQAAAGRTSHSQNSKVIYMPDLLPVLQEFDQTDNLSAKTHTQSVLDSLTFVNEKANGSHEKLLLGLAWLDHQAIDEWMRYPFVLGYDDKNATTNQGLPLGTVVAVDSRGKNIPALRAYLPDKKRWSYHHQTPQGRGPRWKQEEGPLGKR